MGSILFAVDLHQSFCIAVPCLRVLPFAVLCWRAVISLSLSLSLPLSVYMVYSTHRVYCSIMHYNIVVNFVRDVLTKYKYSIISHNPT